MSNRMRLVLMLALVGVVLAGFAAVAQAQQVPPPPMECDNPKFDIDGDGNLDRQDLNEWKLLFVRSGCERLGAPIAADGCSPRLDLDGDGLATRADLDELIQTFLICTRSPFVYPGP